MANMLPNQAKNPIIIIIIPRTKLMLFIINNFQKRVKLGF